MTKKDLLKIFGVVVLAEYICHKKPRKNGLIHRVLRQMDEQDLFRDTERSARLKADLRGLDNA